MTSGVRFTNQIHTFVLLVEQGLRVGSGHVPSTTVVCVQLLELTDIFLCFRSPVTSESERMFSPVTFIISQAVVMTTHVLQNPEYFVHPSLQQLQRGKKKPLKCPTYKKNCKKTRAHV